MRQLRSILGKLSYSLFLWLDRKYIETYGYETAPYCGHYYNGHTGKYTRADYHEGDGTSQNTRFKWLILCGQHTEEGYFFILLPPVKDAINWLRLLPRRTTIVLKKQDDLYLYFKYSPSRYSYGHKRELLINLSKFKVIIKHGLFKD